MKALRAFLVTLLTVLLPPGASAADALSIEDIRLNTAPAFVLLGTTPTTVEQPGSPRALAVSLFAAKDDNSGGNLLPRNVALEFAPYWWFYGKNLTWDDYQLDDTLWLNLGRTLTFSVATAETDLPANPAPTDGTGIGVGFRVNLWKGKPSAAAMKAKNELGVKLKDIAASLPDDPNQPIPIDTISSQYEQQLKNYRDAIRRRDGFQLELAGGASWGYPDDEFNHGVFKSAGVWLTPAYRSSLEQPIGDFQFVGVARYLHHDLTTGHVSTFDLGGRIVWLIPGKPFSASAEVVHRLSDPGGIESTRYGGTVEYQLSDKLALLLSFGHDFKSAVTGDDSNFVLLGFNFGVLQAKATK